MEVFYFIQLFLWATLNLAVFVGFYISLIFVFLPTQVDEDICSR